MAAVPSSYYYFAFGSNLKKTRLLINCKSAKFHCTAELKNYRLAFTGSISKTWGGSSATILPAANGNSVWGAVWLLTEPDVTALDIQEGVCMGIYRRIEIDVESVDKGTLHCISYAKPPDQPEGQPSHTYLEVIIAGAKEISLSPEYIRKLEYIEHNGQGASDKELNKLIKL